MKRKGFTLIELIIAIAIVGVIASIIVSIGAGIGMGKWCDGCRWYFIVGDQHTVKLQDGTELKLCSKHFSQYIMYQNATRGGKSAPFPQE